MGKEGASELFEEPWLTTNIYTGPQPGDELTVRHRADSFEAFLEDKQLRDNDKSAV
jgi:hypothetical protein